MIIFNQNNHDSESSITDKNVHRIAAMRENRQNK